MKPRKCIAFFFLLFLFSCNRSFYPVETLDTNVQIIKMGKFESAIFPKEYNCILRGTVSRFTPTIQEVNHAEEILKKNIKTFNPMYNQGDGCPIIHNNLHNYRRQYFGEIDKDGNKILYVNFLWAKYSIFDWLKGNFKDESNQWKKEKVDVHDGCSSFWNIEINLTREELQNIMINGVG